MPTYAILDVPAAELALAETLERLPDCHFRVEENAFTESDLTVRLWISCAGCDVGEALAVDPSVADHSLLRESDEEDLFRIDVEEGILLPREIVYQYDGTIREAYGGGDEWTLEVRFPSRADLSAAAEAFERYGVDVTYRSIEELVDSADSRLTDLTDSQREVLEKAIELGYYDIPREVTLKELSRELDVSHQALSERLRRAQEKLARDQLSNEVEPESGRVTE